MFFLTALGFFLCIHSLNHASADGLIPAGSTTPQVCAAIEKEYAKSIDLWREGKLREAVIKLHACEDVLKKHNLWMPVNLSKEATADQRKALRLTNTVIFSLASIYQKMGWRTLSDRYARMARERGLLPKIVSSHQKSR